MRNSFVLSLQNYAGDLDIKPMAQLDRSLESVKVSTAWPSLWQDEVAPMIVRLLPGVSVFRHPHRLDVHAAPGADGRPGRRVFQIVEVRS